MDRETAMEEVGFIKKLLEDTGKEFFTNGKAFIGLGLVLFIGKLICDILTTSAIPYLHNSFVVILLLEVSFCICIYQKSAPREKVNTLEKQVWQIWIWGILITIFLNDIIIERTAHTLSVGLSYSYKQIGVNTGILLALVATGVLINQKFFLGLTILEIFLNMTLRLLPDMGWITRLIQGLVLILLPLLATGIYFLTKQRHQKQTGAIHGTK